MFRPATLLFFLSLVLPAAALAQPGAVPPSYSVSPSFNGLNITYFIKQDTFKISLYVINHEKFPVICDAHYTSGSDKQNIREETLESEKGTAFKFTYGRHGNHIQLKLLCVKPGSPEHLHKTEPES